MMNFKEFYLATRAMIYTDDGELVSTSQMETLDAIGAHVIGFEPCRKDGEYAIIVILDKYL